MDILNLMGISQETYTETVAAPAGESSVLESGAYKMVIKEVAVFETEKKAKMLKIELTDETSKKDRVFYFNTSYVDKKTNEVTENKSGTKAFKALVDALHMEPAQITTAQAEFEAYGKKVQGTKLSLEGRPVLVLVREIEDPNKEQFQVYNDIEGFADVEGKIKDKDGNYSDEPLAKWKEKLEKTPRLVKKAKGNKASATTTATAASPAAAEAAKALM